MVLLLALACGKRVGNLQALSTSTACMECSKDDCMIRLQARRGYVPKMLSMLFRAQVIMLHAFAPQDSEPVTYPLCPVCALQAYVERTSHFRLAEQLFICFGGFVKGLPVSKQRLSNWIVEAIAFCHMHIRVAYMPTPREKRFRHGIGLLKVCRFRIFV